MMSIDQAIAILLSKHNAAVVEEVTEPIVTRNAPKKERPIQKKGNSLGEKAQVVKAKTGQAMFGIMLPEKGSLDARGFMIAIRSAGMRPNDRGILSYNQPLVRDDMIKAIAGYVGYDVRGDFAQQDLAARTQAQREFGTLKVPNKTRAEERQAFRSVAGYVAGVCDQHAKRIAELDAKVVLLTDSIIEHERACEDSSLPALDRDAHEVMAITDRGRLEQVFADLALMGSGQMKLVNPFTGR